MCEHPMCDVGPPVDLMIGAAPSAGARAWWWIPRRTATCVSGSVICLTTVPRRQGGSTMSEAAGLRLSCAVRGVWLSYRSSTTSETTGRRAGDPRRRLHRHVVENATCGRVTGSRFTAPMRPGETRLRQRSSATRRTASRASHVTSRASHALSSGRANRQSHRSGGLRRRLASRFGDHPCREDPPELSARGPVLPHIEMRDVASFETGGRSVPGPPRSIGCLQGASRPGKPRRARMTSSSTG
jgi:hypothetical protein